MSFTTLTSHFRQPIDRTALHLEIAQRRRLYYYPDPVFSVEQTVEAQTKTPIQGLLEFAFR